MNRQKLRDDAKRNLARHLKNISVYLKDANMEMYSHCNTTYTGAVDILFMLDIIDFDEWKILSDREIEKFTP